MERKADNIARAVAICNKEVPHPPQKRKANQEASKEQMRKRGN